MQTTSTKSLGLAALAGFVLILPATAAVTINLATVGNAGNANDPATGYGAVAYTYKIAKNETTIGQYAEFLSAKAKSDPYALYSASMTTSHINGISRSGVSGSYSYTVNPGSANKPITYVSWWIPSCVPRAATAIARHGRAMSTASASPPSPNPRQ